MGETKSISNAVPKNKLNTKPKSKPNRLKTRKISVRDITLIGVFTALTAVLSQIIVILPFTPVQISLGVIAVYMSGILLKPHQALLSQVCFLLLGAAGAPVFGQFRGGIGALLGPTGGYLIVYPLMAFIVSYTLNNRKSLRAASGKNGKVWTVALSAVSITVSHMLLYFGGTLWLAFVNELSYDNALLMGVRPFVMFDVIKILLCVMASVPIRSRLTAARLLKLQGTGVK